MALLLARNENQAPKAVSHALGDSQRSGKGLFLQGSHSLPRTLHLALA